MRVVRPVAAPICELLESSAFGLRAQTAAAATLAVSTGQNTLTIDLDTLRTIDDAVIAAIVAASRIMRDAGGGIQILTNREHVGVASASSASTASQ
jgi:hypothetical protein